MVLRVKSSSGPIWGRQQDNVAGPDENSIDATFVDDEAIVLKRNAQATIQIILVPAGMYIHASQTIIKEQSFKKQSWIVSILDK